MDRFCEAGGLIDLPEAEARQRIANAEALDAKDPRAAGMVEQAARAVTSVSAAQPSHATATAAAPAPAKNRR
jgi:hypothetical protein